jgi:hypothetical protein
VAGYRHGPGGEDHQDRAEQDDAAQVRTDLPHGRGQALPVQQHGKEEQQHYFGRELGLADGRDETEQRAHDEQHDGRRDVEAPAQDVAHQYGRAQGDDEFETEHVAYSWEGTDADGGAAAATGIVVIIGGSAAELSNVRRPWG